MDLRSVLNNSDTGDRDDDRERERDRATSKAPPTPQQQSHQLPTHHQQSPASYPYREYGHHPPQPHQSPGQPSHHEYPPSAAHHHASTGPYASPQSHQQSSAYPGRPAPPALQPTNSFHDARSPTGSMLAPSPTGYRPTPTPSAGPAGASGSYAFPPSQAHPQEVSPSMRHQYPPTPYQPHQPQRQDSYAHGSGSYAQQPGPVPQASPVATPGVSGPYPHQRSQSTHSTPTPTSAHGQHQYGPPYAHGSPVVATHPPPAEYNRQPSHPPTPLAPPLSAAQTQTQPGGAVPYAQQQQEQPQQSSTLLYKQRMPSATGAPVVQTQTSPPPHGHQPPTPSSQRMPSLHGAHDLLTSEDHQLPPSRHERDHSLSVSPKTRVPSLPPSADRKSFSTEIDPRQMAANDAMAIDADSAVTPAKRKLEDRDLSPKELERKEKRPPPGEINGGHLGRGDTATIKSESPAMPRKRRTWRAEPPVWALDCQVLGNKLPKHANFVLQKRTHAHLNGGQSDVPSRSRHNTPEKANVQSSQPPAPVAEPGPQDTLGPWEASITGVRPYEEVSRMVADFLFLNVVNNEDMQEIMSRGIKFEIEAKLGTLIDKDTNHRVERAIDSEAILQDTGRIAFKSSMTEAHHKAFNEFLNHIVVETDPRSGNGRVQLQYKHRREIDRFIDLPPELQARIPGCMRSRLGPRAKNVRVRLTYDQKSKEVLAKIIKARVADIDLHLPSCPMDCRLSINLEMDWDGPAHELEQLAASQPERQPDRNKDRLSYTHGHYQIDLTQVTQQAQGPANSTRTEKEHELEVELAPEILIDQGHRAQDGAPHHYQELVEGLVDNIRVLARKSRDFGEMS